MMPLQQELLFDLMEYSSDVNIFFDRYDFKAKGAGLIITSDAVGHFPKKKGDKYTVWFGRGIERWSFKRFADAAAQCYAIMKQSKDIKYFRIEGKSKKQFERELAKLKNPSPYTKILRVEKK